MPVIAEHIVTTPGTCSGKPRIAGTRIKVAQVVIWHDQMGLSPAEIVACWSHLKLADVYAALAYYHDHREEIDADIRAGEEASERFESRQTSLLEKVAAKKIDILTLSAAAALAFVRSGHCPAEDIDRLRADLSRRLASAPADPDLTELREHLERQPQG